MRNHFKIYCHWFIIDKSLNQCYFSFIHDLIFYYVFKLSLISDYWHHQFSNYWHHQFSNYWRHQFSNYWHHQFPNYWHHQFSHNWRHQFSNYWRWCCQITIKIGSTDSILLSVLLFLRIFHLSVLLFLGIFHLSVFLFLPQIDRIDFKSNIFSECRKQSHRCTLFLLSIVSQSDSFIHSHDYSSRILLSLIWSKPWKLLDPRSIPCLNFDVCQKWGVP